MNWQIPSPSLILAPDEIHIWKTFLKSPPSYAQLLSTDEQQRANRFIFEKHHNRFVAGRAILRSILSGYLQIEPQDICFSYQPNGKPDLAIVKEALPLRFNLAHTGDLAVYAVTIGTEVGIDVEQVRSYPEASKM